MGKVIGFMNVKSGVGKTSTALAVAHAWARSGRRILLVDMDPQAGLTNIIGGVGALDRTMSDVFIEGDSLDFPGLPVKATGIDNLDFCPSALGLMDFEEFGNDGRKEPLLIFRNVLARIKDDYDFVFVDCPSGYSLVHKSALMACDYGVMITKIDHSSLSGVELTMQYIDSHIIRDNSGFSFIGCVVNSYNRAAERRDPELIAIHNELKDMFHPYLIRPEIRESSAVSRSMLSHSSVITHSTDSRLVDDYLKVAEEILTIVLDIIKFGPVKLGKVRM